MASLLERLISPLARAESVRTWPPAVVRDGWDEAEDNLRRYKNNREDRLAHAPEFSGSSYGRRIYTPLAIAREVCNFSAEMLFSADPEITFEADEDLLERVEDANGLGARLIAMAAIIAAQGRGGLRVITDTDVNPDGVPLITHVHEHEVIWDERHGGFVVGGAVIIQRQFKDTAGGMNSDVYRLVEEHVTGGITRKLYRGLSSQMGSPIPIDTLDEFKGLPEEEETGLDTPTLVRWDNVSGGYSDLTGAQGVLDRIDSEVSYGAEKSEKSRPVSMAPAELFDGDGRIDVSGIIPIRAPRLQQMGEEDMQKRFGTIQPDFLADETIAWIDFLIDASLMTMGYSKASYGRDDGAAESGTAIKRRQWRTLIKASGKGRMAIEAIKNALAIAMALESGGAKVADLRPEMKLGDPFPRDDSEKAQEAGLWATAGAISLEEKIKMRRPDWDDETVEEEAARIKGETEQAPGPRGSIENAQALIEHAVRGNGATPNGEAADESPSSPR